MKTDRQILTAELEELQLRRKNVNLDGKESFEVYKKIQTISELIGQIQGETLKSDLCLRSSEVEFPFVKEVLIELGDIIADYTEEYLPRFGENCYIVKLSSESL